MTVGILEIFGEAPCPGLGGCLGGLRFGLSFGLAGGGVGVFFCFGDLEPLGSLSAPIFLFFHFFTAFFLSSSDSESELSLFLVLCFHLTFLLTLGDVLDVELLEVEDSSSDDGLNSLTLSLSKSEETLEVSSESLLLLVSGFDASSHVSSLS